MASFAQEQQQRQQEIDEKNLIASTAPVSNIPTDADIEAAKAALARAQAEYATNVTAYRLPSAQDLGGGRGGRHRAKVARQGIAQARQLYGAAVDAAQSRLNALLKAQQAPSVEAANAELAAQRQAGYESLRPSSASNAVGYNAATGQIELGRMDRGGTIISTDETTERKRQEAFSISKGYTPDARLDPRSAVLGGPVDQGLYTAGLRARPSGSIQPPPQRDDTISGYTQSKNNVINSQQQQNAQTLKQYGTLAGTVKPQRPSRLEKLLSGQPQKQTGARASIKSIVEPIQYRSLRGTNITAKEFRDIMAGKKQDPAVKLFKQSEKALVDSLPSSMAQASFAPKTKQSSIPKTFSLPPAPVAGFVVAVPQPQELTQEQVNKLTPSQYQDYKKQYDDYNTWVGQENKRVTDYNRQIKTEEGKARIQQNKETRQWLRDVESQGFSLIIVKTGTGSKTVPIDKAFQEIIRTPNVTRISAVPIIPEGMTLAGHLSEPILIPQTKVVKQDITGKVREYYDPSGGPKPEPLSDPISQATRVLDKLKSNNPLVQAGKGVSKWTLNVGGGLVNLENLIGKHIAPTVVPYRTSVAVSQMFNLPTPQYPPPKSESLLVPQTRFPEIPEGHVIGGVATGVIEGVQTRQPKKVLEAASKGWNDAVKLAEKQGVIETGAQVGLTILSLGGSLTLKAVPRVATYRIPTETGELATAKVVASYGDKSAVIFGGKYSGGGWFRGLPSKEFIPYEQMSVPVGRGFEKEGMNALQRTILQKHALELEAEKILREGTLSMSQKAAEQFQRNIKAPFKYEKKIPGKLAENIPEEDTVDIAVRLGREQKKNIDAIKGSAVVLTVKEPGNLKNAPDILKEPIGARTPHDVDLEELAEGLGHQAQQGIIGAGELPSGMKLVPDGARNIGITGEGAAFRSKPFKPEYLEQILPGVPKEARSIISGGTEKLEFHHIIKGKGIKEPFGVPLTFEEHKGITALQGQLGKIPEIKGSKEVLELFGERTQYTPELSTKLGKAMGDEAIRKQIQQTLREAAKAADDLGGGKAKSAINIVGLRDTGEGPAALEKYMQKGFIFGRKIPTGKQKPGIPGQPEKLKFYKMPFQFGTWQIQTTALQSRSSLDAALASGKLTEKQVDAILGGAKMGMFPAGHRAKNVVDEYINTLKVARAYWSKGRKEPALKSLQYAKEFKEYHKAIDWEAEIRASSKEFGKPPKMPPAAEPGSPPGSVYGGPPFVLKNIVRPPPPTDEVKRETSMVRFGRSGYSNIQRESQKQVNDISKLLKRTSSSSKRGGMGSTSPLIKSPTGYYAPRRDPIQKYLRESQPSSPSAKSPVGSLKFPPSFPSRPSDSNFSFPSRSVPSLPSRYNPIGSLGSLGSPTSPRSPLIPTSPGTPFVPGYPRTPGSPGYPTYPLKPLEYPPGAYPPGYPPLGSWMMHPALFRTFARDLGYTKKFYRATFESKDINVKYVHPIKFQKVSKSSKIFQQYDKLDDAYTKKYYDALYGVKSREKGKGKKSKKKR